MKDNVVDINIILNGSIINNIPPITKLKIEDKNYEIKDMYNNLKLYLQEGEINC